MSRKLQYFNFNGYAEPIRYMLHYGRLDFEDVRYTRAEWPNKKEIKDTLPFGQLPVYEENGETINQSVAIARYVASEVGLLPSSAWEQAKLDADVHNVYDFLEKMKVFMMDKNPDKKEENQKSMDETTEFFLSRFDKKLEANNGYFGGKLTWADFMLVGAIEIFNLYLQVSLEKNYPAIKALISKIHSLPGVKEYIEKRGPYTM